MYPQLAAQHLLDGLPIELLDGDSNMVNMKWIRATLKNLEEQLSSGDINSKRIFVLSVMGVQSSGKSTLLNIMFGIEMKTSVGQCTRGINMQLIPVSGRAEYDYILLLDTEGTRAPEYWGLPGSDKRDNQMATLSILLADATIIVNPGENDAAIKEILPIVLLAYQGSKLAEEKGGRLSSMVFFVYNRIDTQQKDKLGDILQILGTSLNEAFFKVSQLSGSGVEGAVTITSADPSTSTDLNQDFNNSSQSAAVGYTNRRGSRNKSISLFRQFKLDASNSSESDVRIVGNIKKNYNPPDDVPDPAYGEALCEFREHIHNRVTQDKDSSVKSSERNRRWTSRSLTEILDYLNLVWVCICSADFTLNFKTVIERAAFDQLNLEYKKCEKGLTYLYYESNAQIEKEILKQKVQVQQAINEIQFDSLTLKLGNLVEGKETKLDHDVKEALEQPGRSNWKSDFDNRWTVFKSTEKQRWLDRLRTFFHCQLKYDLHIDECKKAMRLNIREIFSDEEAKKWDDQEKEKQFNELFKKVLAQAKKAYPPIDVKGCVDKVYFNDVNIKALQINLYNNYTMDKVINDFKKAI